MARERALADLKTRFRVDYSELTKAEKAVARAHGEFASKTDKSSLAATALEKRLGTVGAALRKLGPAGATAGKALDDVGSIAGSASGSIGLAAGIAAGVGVAALGLVTAGALKAESAYEGLAEKVDNYQDITNSTAEQASRMVHVSDVLGVSTDTLAGSMFKLSRAIAENPKKLEELGVTIRTNADGNVDLTETLFSVADAYNATSDASKRMRILFAAFGRSGFEMIDVVEQGSARLRELAAATKLVLTDDDIQRAREYKIHQEEIKTGWDEWWATLGQKVQPILDSVQESILRGAYVQDKLNQAVKDGTISEQDLRDAKMGARNAASELELKLIAEYDATQKARFAMDLHTQTIKEQEEANRRLVDSMNQVIDALAGEENASLADRRAKLAVADAAARVRDAHKRYTEAVKEFGKNSAQAHQALRDYQGALLDQEDANYRAAEAAKKLAEAQAQNEQGQVDAVTATKAYIDQLQKEANALAPGSPLRKNLQAYIDELKNKLPDNITTTLHLVLPARGAGFHGTGIEGRAGGGDVDAGVPYWVGEQGKPELFVPNRPGRIVPAVQAGTPAGAREDQILHITIDVPVMLDGQVIGQVTDRRIARVVSAMGAV